MKVIMLRMNLHVFDMEDSSECTKKVQDSQEAWVSFFPFFCLSFLCKGEGRKLFACVNLPDILLRLVRYRCQVHIAWQFYGRRLDPTFPFHPSSIQLTPSHRLFHDNFVPDNPVPKNFSTCVPSATNANPLTCDPNDFQSSGFTLRQRHYDPPRRLRRDDHV